jgi:hypothetical protein
VWGREQLLLKTFFSEDSLILINVVFPSGGVSAAASSPVVSRYFVGF